MKAKDYGALVIKDGHWWGCVNIENGVNTWAPVGKVSKMSVCEAIKCFMLARWYLQAGILGNITGPIIRENGARLIEVIPGTAPCTDAQRALIDQHIRSEAA